MNEARKLPSGAGFHGEVIRVITSVTEVYEQTV